MQTLILTTENESQTNLLIKLAKELHIKVLLVPDGKTAEKVALAHVAETSFAKDWNSEEDAHWDQFLKNARDVSAR